MRPFETAGARIRREAADWVVRLGETSSEADRARFACWYGADRRHANAYDRLQRIWNLSEEVAPSIPAGQTLRPAIGRGLGLVMAASVIVALLAGVLLVSGIRSGDLENVRRFATAPGQMRMIALPDGSQVILGKGTRIAERFTDSERRLSLETGRARFAVARSGRPFVVESGAGEIVATGTVFDVSRSDTMTSVVLIEGSVEVRGAAGHRSRRLRAGEKLVYAVPAGRMAVQAPSPGETGWTQGMIEFRNARLAEVVALAGRDGAQAIRLGDARLSDLTVTGTLRTGDAAELAAALAAALGLQVRRLPNGDLLLVAPAGTA